MPIRLKHTRGSSALLPVLVVSTLIGGMMLLFSSAIKVQRTVPISLNRKVVAELYAAELLEFFQTLSAVKAKQYLSKNPINNSLPPYPLCAHINMLDRAGEKVVNRDPIAALPAVTPLGENNEATQNQPNRFYQVQVIDLTTMQLDPRFCSLDMTQVALQNQIANPGQTKLSINERLYITVGVSWRFPSDPVGQIHRVTLNTTLIN